MSLGCPYYIQGLGLLYSLLGLNDERSNFNTVSYDFHTTHSKHCVRSLEEGLESIIFKVDTENNLRNSMTEQFTQVAWLEVINAYARSE
jgi:hypothetical protein